MSLSFTFETFLPVFFSEPYSMIFLVICLGLEPRTPSLKGMCSTC